MAKKKESNRNIRAGMDQAKSSAADTYDVLVIGAGPAGSAAAKAAAEGGAETILLEEHHRIGIPSHCTGALHSSARPDILTAILETMDKRVVIRKPGDYTKTQLFAPDGSALQSDEWPSHRYLIDRAVFDQELAKQAVRAGAKLLLNTRVTGLIKKNNRIIGVTTASRSLPEVFCKIVIAADGIAGGVRGVAKWEGLIAEDQAYVGGITMELTGLKDCYHKAGLYTGAYLEKGWFSITPSGPHSCIVQFMNLDEYKRVMEGNYYLSQILKNTVPIRMDGWRHTSNLGVRFREIVKDGLILTGSAANWRGTTVAVVSGRCAGEVAAEAVKEGDVTARRLSEFIDLYEKAGLIKELYQHSDWLRSRPLGRLSDEEIEKWLTEMIKKNGQTYIPSAPVLGFHGRCS
ncbi:MAG: NAD(P)/FAD-dependent oxidoreductase [Deltaproteobacteria bacterium]|nr:NAD(P)/FAD-dependent oxidoreductase [Deltaproteobacteria bacterium]